MRKYIFSLLSVFVTLTASAAKEVTINEVFNNPLMANRIKASTPMPDGETYACMEGDKIITYSYATGKKQAVIFDIDHTIGEKVSSIDGFVLSPDGQKMLVYTNAKSIYRHSFVADYYIYNIATRRMARLSDGGPQRSPVWSRDGNQVAFVRDNNIFLIKLLYDNSESQVTKDGKINSIINGVPDWVNEEEFSNDCSLCFTADGSQIVWLKYDESRVPEYSLQMFKGLKPEHKENTAYPGAYTYKYPKAGQDNAVVTAWSYDIQARRIQQLQLPLAADDYICRLFPTDEAQSVVLLTLNRHQDCLNVYKANPRSTVCQLLFAEKNKRYVIPDAYEQMIVKDGRILLLSDRNGHRHIYEYSMTGTLQRSVTPSDIDITALYGKDAKTGDIYYQAAPTPQTRSIFVAHANGKTEELTPRKGTNSAIFSATMKYFVNTFSSHDTPYVYTACNNRGKVLTTLQDNAGVKAKRSEYNLPQVEFFDFTTSEGVKLNGVMFRPANFNPSRRYPVVMYQYSGPASQQVLDSWRLGQMGEGAIFEAMLCQQGYITVMVDGRGTGARGEEFEKCTYQQLGLLESRDQVEAALWLSKQSYVDAEHIGIWGWSYGGFNTLMSMSEGRPVFAAGVAVAPPTDWRFYDSIYTERYMRTPKENPSGYDINPIKRVDNMHGALLLIHGLADDNVHPQNSFEFSEAMVQADKDFRELLYTNRNHSIYGGNTRKHLYRQILNHFNEHLK